MVPKQLEFLLACNQSSLGFKNNAWYEEQILPSSALNLLTF